jgi:hypothetical protein
MPQLEKLPQSPRFDAGVIGQFNALPVLVAIELRTIVLVIG